jgi:hypothetical protein
VGSDGGLVPPPPEGGAGGAARGGRPNTGGTEATGSASNTGGISGAGGSGPVTPVGEANVYGGPVANASEFPATCPDGPVYQDQIDCLGFGQCKHACQHDDECPGVASGSAVPVCSFSLYCQLLCDEGRTCPTGMTCMRLRAGTFCMWQNRVVGCGSFDPCSTRPRPPFCPEEACAREAVACSEALGVECCEGLACGPENFCVKEGS